MIKIKTYNISSLALTPTILQSYIARFWRDVYASLDHKNSYLSLVVKVRFYGDHLY